ncbi:MAG: peptide deformylase [bacterium]|nr:peptide deformylase [bacterium]
MSQIVTVPSEILRTPALPVEALDSRIQKVLVNMGKALRKAVNPTGVGLAAPQIGETLQIFMIRPQADGPITTFINPQITKYSQRQISPTGKKGVYEGCLSLPNHYAPIKRSSSVTVKFQDANMRFQTQVFSGFAAHVIQHEMDHLNGILFIDRALEQNSKLFRVKGDDWEEVSL